MTYAFVQASLRDAFGNWGANRGLKSTATVGLPLRGRAGFGHFCEAGKPRVHCPFRSFRLAAGGGGAGIEDDAGDFEPVPKR